MSIMTSSANDHPIAEQHSKAPSRILLEELQNACMDSIRAAFSKTQDWDAPTICGKDLSLAYDTTPELPKLRFFMCFQAALQLTTRSQSDDSDWMDEQLTQLL
ncbi:MAG: hypothetical protein Q9221_006884 [Calogaya cf. arnoldii]